MFTWVLVAEDILINFLLRRESVTHRTVTHKGNKTKNSHWWSNGRARVASDPSNDNVKSSWNITTKTLRRESYTTRTYNLHRLTKEKANKVQEARTWIKIDWAHNVTWIVYLIKLRTYLYIFARVRPSKTLQVQTVGKVAVITDCWAGR